MPTTTITATAPQSVNETTGATRAKSARIRKAYRLELQRLIHASDLPRPVPGDRVHCTAVLTFPAIRSRDEGNYRAPLEKAAGDALVPKPSKRDREVARLFAAQGKEPPPLPLYLTDDTPEHFTFGEVTFIVDQTCRRPSCTIEIAWGDAL